MSKMRRHKLVACYEGRPDCLARVKSMKTAHDKTLIQRQIDSADKQTCPPCRQAAGSISCCVSLGLTEAAMSLPELGIC